MKCLNVASSVLVLLGIVSGHAGGQVQYTVTDLGTLGGSGSWAYGINSSGQVVGSARDVSNHDRAFIYSNGIMRDVRAVMGDPTQSSSFAKGINSSGEVAGATTITTADNRSYAFFYSSGNVTDLGTVPGTSYTSSYAYGINDIKEVVGCCLMGFSGNWPVYHAFLWSKGSMKDLGAPQDYPSTKAYAINNNGQVVGSMTNSSNTVTRPFLYSGGSMTDIGALSGFTDASAAAINNSGQIVGTCYTTSDVSRIFRAFLWDNGEAVDLGTLAGYAHSGARDVNESGMAVGDVMTADYLVHHAVLFNNGSVTDLNDLIDPAAQWTLSYAYAINDSGWIVGHGTNPDGNGHAFLLTPIPEPSTLVLLGISALGLAGFVWRRQST